MHQPGNFIWPGACDFGPKQRHFDYKYKTWILKLENGGMKWEYPGLQSAAIGKHCFVVGEVCSDDWDGDVMVELANMADTYGYVVFDTNPLRGDQALQFLVGSLFEYGTSSASNHQFQVMFDHSFRGKMMKYGDQTWVLPPGLMASSWAQKRLDVGLQKADFQDFRLSQRSGSAPRSSTLVMIMTMLLLLVVMMVNDGE